MATQRNGSIDLLKFLLILSITLYHGIKICNIGKGMIFYNGGSAVEPFYIIAGFFMARSAFYKKKDAFTYMWGRYKEVFPYHTFAFVLAFIYKCIISGFFALGVAGCITGIIKQGIMAVPEFFLLSPITGLQKNLGSINSIEWYLGAMLIGMALIYPFLKKWPKQFCSYAAPLLFLFGSGILLQTNGSYVTTFSLIWLICGGLIRAIVTLSAGTFVFWMVKTAQENLNLTTAKARWIATIGAFVCWIVSFWFLMTDQPRDLEFAVIYFMIGGCFFSNLGITYTNRLLDNRFVHFLAKVSFPMFLNQSWIRKVLIKLDLKGMGISYAMCMVIFVAAVIVVSLICIFVMDAVMDRIHRKRAFALKR